ncbi:hypothetical protein [Bacillus sp. es.034]|uniref:hypothetical protein n=1 Tax=Bacillus sp. es.034 TaxID=1761763 RepID=UPI000BF3DE25|nr:hypothetical protein [Bacillus sp. es.034]PFG07166.1 hypothetical protein ATG71_4037 [Bacillus sp. es.034]
MTYNEKQALLYAEKYGVLDYEVLEGFMVYEVVYILEGFKYLCKVDLTTMKETRQARKIKAFKSRI